MILRFCLLLSLLFWGGLVTAQEKAFSLRAPDKLIETGILEYLLPRFSLKTGVRITLDGDPPEAVFTEDTGIPVLQGPQVLWHIDHVPGPHTDRFLDWLQSDIGARTIASYRPHGTPIFSQPKPATEKARAESPAADTQAGERLSLLHCGRCHVVNETNRMSAIGSTPSFAVLRTLSGWATRFETFYVLRPHGAFTQIEDVTRPFDPARPSPIVPIELSRRDLDAILAYVATVAPADLGAPIQSQ